MAEWSVGKEIVGEMNIQKIYGLYVYNITKWRNGQVGWVLSGFGGSMWEMGKKWSVGQWIVHARKLIVCRVQNVIKWRNGQIGWVLDGSGGSDHLMGLCGWMEQQQEKIELLSLWSVKRWVSQKAYLCCGILPTWICYPAMGSLHYKSWKWLENKRLVKSESDL